MGGAFFFTLMPEQPFRQFRRVVPGFGHFRDATHTEHYPFRRTYGLSLDFCEPGLETAVPLVSCSNGVLGSSSRLGRGAFAELALRKPSKMGNLGHASAPTTADNLLAVAARAGGRSPLLRPVRKGIQDAKSGLWA